MMNKGKCEKYLDNHNVRLYLCGHAHNAWFSSFGEKGKQITSGCLKAGGQFSLCGI